MSCTSRCKTAAPGTCCCSCEGANHGEAAPVQQKRLALAEPGMAELIVLATERDPERVARITDELIAASAVDIGQLMREAEIHPEDCACEACISDPVVRAEFGRVPHDRTIEGRTVHLSPGYRYTLDSEEGEPIWFAYFGARHESAVDPDVAARKALGLHGPPA